MNYGTVQTCDKEVMVIRVDSVSVPQDAEEPKAWCIKGWLHTFTVIDKYGGKWTIPGNSRDSYPLGEWFWLEMHVRGSKPC